MSTAYEHKTELVGDDYEGLPTTPLRYRGARKGSSIDWDQINTDYVARGGQVDASVWPKHGKVVVIGDSTARSSRANLHTFVEASQYDEPAAPKRSRTKKQPQSTATGRRLTDPERDRLCQQYRDGESITGLAKIYGLSTSSVRHTLKRREVPIRSISDAAKLRWEVRR